ncbi:MAG: 3'-5' exonuclease domain-containing protein 2 [Dysgonamonadaceae bacterium]|nr:3'-5' exonuclease domain-containing protein 2 [Dysgonamonadaceae bacterium]
MGRTITKEEISILEIEEFRGRVVVVDTIEKAEKAVKYLSSFSKLGFDTETRPSYRKGCVFGVALIQLSTDDTCFLFRLSIIGFPDCLIRLLSNLGIQKIGLSLRDDFLSMSRRKKFVPQGFLDLQTIVSQHDIKDISLQKVYALLFEKKISKSQRLTNWESDMLTEAQQKYAALDAWACLKVYEKLIEEKNNVIT